MNDTAGLFYRKVLAVRRSLLFRGRRHGPADREQAAFLAMALGGPNSHAGADLRTAHARLTGLNDWHFDRVIGHLRSTLRELGAAEPDIAAAGAPGTKR